MYLGGRAEVFIAQAGIERQPRGDADIVLEKPSPIRVALVLAEVSGSSGALKKIAEAAGVLRGALPEQKVGKALHEQKAGSDEGRVENELMALGFAADPEIVAAIGKRHGVLPHKGVGVLKVERLAERTDREEPLDLD